VRLAIDPDTAQGLARPQGCRGRAALIDGWELRNGTLILTGEGQTLSRLALREDGQWRGRDRDALGAIELSRP
jgi:hypothetical protein